MSTRYAKRQPRLKGPVRSAAGGKTDEALGRLAAIVESADDAIIAATVDGAITDWNAGAERLYGYSAHEALGRSISCILPPGQRNEMPAIIERVKRGERVSSLEAERVRKDGSRVLVSLTVSPIKDSAGNIIGCSGISRDITQRKRAEEALRQSEERFEALVENATDGMTVVADDGTRVFVNQAFVDLVGLRNKGEAVSRPFDELFEPADRERARARVRRLLQGLPGPPVVEMRIRRPDGSVRVAQVTGARVMYQGRPSVLGILRDVTEQKRYTETLERAIGRLAIEENLDQTLGRLLADAREQTRATHAHLAMWSALGVVDRFIPSQKSAEQSGPAAIPLGLKSVIDILRSERRPLRIDDISQDARLRTLVPDDPQAARFLGVPVIYQGRTSGALCLTNPASAPPFSAEDERLLGLFAALVGVILDNDRLYQSASEQRGTLESILAGMKDGVAVFDQDHRLKYLNSSARDLLGWEHGDPTGRDILELAALYNPHHQTQPGAKEALLAVLEGASDRPATHDVAWLGPPRRDLSVAAFPIPVQSGGPMAGLLIRDVTRERDLERRKDTFVSVASHELRTPMGSIMGFSELLLLGGESEAERRQWLTYIHEESERMVAILDDLLNVSRIRSGKIAVELEPLPLQKVIEVAVSRIRPMTTRHQFVVSVPPATPSAMADRDKLLQVITNLLSNAVKYSPKGGPVTVSARHEPERSRVVLAVADRGIGIGPDDLKRLFTTFHRIRRPETEGIRGTGLGLYIVKSLVELMHGEVWLESELGRGSTFFVSLPASSGEATDSG